MIKYLFICFLFFQCSQSDNILQSNIDADNTSIRFIERKSNFLEIVDKYRIETTNDGYRLFVYPEDCRYQTDLIVVITREPLKNIIEADAFYYPNIKPKSDGSAMVNVLRDPNELLAIYIHLLSVTRGE